MITKYKRLILLEEFKEKNFGKRGTKKRDKLESGYNEFKIGAVSQSSPTVFDIKS